MTEPLVGIYPSEAGGSSFYRLHEPARVLKAGGFPIVEDVPLHGQFEDTKVREPVYKGEQLLGYTEHTVTRLVDMLRPPLDVVVFQRPILDERVQMIPMLQRLGVAVVVELDDDFKHIQAGNIAWKVLHPTFGDDPRRSWRNVNRAAALADVLTVSTRSLEDVYTPTRRGPTVVLPNLLPASYLEIGARTLERPERVNPRIGWSGSVATHPWDLEQTRGAVAEVLRRHPDWEFHGIGTGVGLAQRLHLEPEQVHHTDGWVDLEEYPSRMAELDLGIVPLEPNTFNRGKSYLKGLEWAGLGVAFVASPLAEYTLLHTMGAGWLAKRSKDWRRQLDTLMSNRDARQELAFRGYEMARKQTYEEHAERWWKVWAGAVDHRGDT